MANYYGVTRTNYFNVTDPEKLKDIVERINWDLVSEPDFFVEENGQFAFGAYSSICGLKPEANVSAGKDLSEDEDDDEYEPEAVYEALQKVVAPGSAIIITEIGFEKLRYLTAYSVVITQDALESEGLRSQSLSLARRLLGNPAYDPRMEY